MSIDYKPRRRYDIEFKREAVRLAASPDRSIEGVARDLDIHPNMLHRWKREFFKNQQDSFPGTGHQTPEEARFKKLEKELADKNEECEILKKALAIFSERPK